MDIMKVTARWSGFTGGPGYSNFYFAAGGGLISDAQQIADRVSDAFEEIRTLLPTSVTIEIEPEVIVLDSDTGVATGFQNITPPTAIEGGSNADYSGPVGAVVNWRTGDVRFGRRIRGRTFLVPLTTGVFDAQGSLEASQLPFLNSFADTLVGGDLDSELVVWSRPRDGAGGVAATVTSYNVPDLAAVLRSRRD